MFKKNVLMVVFGALDLFAFYRAFPSLGFLSVLKVITVLSLLVSGPLFIVDSRIGYAVYYFQFPFRFLFTILTFGFVFKIIPTQTGTLSHGMVTASVFALEAVRLMVTIQKNKVNI